MEKFNGFENAEVKPENNLETLDEIMTRYKGERNTILFEFLKKTHTDTNKE